MRRPQACLKRIVQVREAAVEAHSAYLMRARVHRMILSIQRMIANEHGYDVTTPGTLEIPSAASEAHRELARISNDIFLDSRLLTQRSAALDERWQRGWSSLSSKLDRLEELLKTLDQDSSKARVTG